MWLAHQSVLHQLQACGNDDVVYAGMERIGIFGALYHALLNLRADLIFLVWAVPRCWHVTAKLTWCLDDRYLPADFNTATCLWALSRRV